MATFPPFISWVRHGAASLAPPGVFTNATTHLFTFKSSAQAMQSLTDELLNAAGRGVVQYKTFVGRSLVTFMDVERCTSGTDIIGWVPGRECAFWIPLLEFRTGRLLPRFVLWAPYIFIDYTIGMLTGREVWGWSKVSADIAVAADAPTSPAAFTCTTTIFDRLDANTRGSFSTLFSVTSPNALTRPPSAWANGKDAAQHIIGDLLGDLEAAIVELLGLKPAVPAVAMKQFRDSKDSALACYQEIVDSPAVLTRFGGGGLLRAADFTLEIATCESHPIVRDYLGIAPTPGVTRLPIEWAAWSCCDFNAPAGDVLSVVS